METKLFDTFRTNLQEKRKNLTEWLRTAPTTKRETRLGPATEQDLQVELREIDQSIQKAEDHTLGICRICHDYVDPELLQMDYTASVCLDHFSDSEKRNLENELEFAQTVQRAMLPNRVPVIPNMEVDAYSRPAQIIGGDYFDFFRFNNGNYGIAIGDAVGHGVSASLLMASIHAALETLIPMQETPVEVIERINHLFLHNINVTTFASLFLCSFDPATYQLSYTNAGHNPPILIRNQNGRPGKIEQLNATGAAIGMVDGIPYSSKTLQLTPGDLLLLYTDGAVEAMNPKSEIYGMERLEDCLRQSFRLPTRELIRTLLNGIEDFAGSRQVGDDMTVIACRIDGLT
jgi:sigma-B regulation protein RsbU (phosphoserine phosphatase)